MQFVHVFHRLDCRNAFPPHLLTQCCLEELAIHHAVFGGKGTLVRGDRGEKLFMLG